MNLKDLPEPLCQAHLVIYLREKKTFVVLDKEGTLLTQLSSDGANQLIGDSMGWDYTPTITIPVPPEWGVLGSTWTRKT